MKICVCMWYDDNIKEYADLAKDINKKYCDLHNYTLLIGRKKYFDDRHVAWEKIYFVYINLKDYDYVIWIDADAFFNIDNKNNNMLEDIIKKKIKKDIIFSEDIPFNGIINSGIFIVKNTDYSHKFLETIINTNEETCKMYFFKNNWEQECIRYYYNIDINNLKYHSIIIKYGILQNFNSESEKSLIIHFAGRDNKYRKEQLLKFKNKYFYTK